MELILRFLSIINLGVALSVPKIKPKKVLYFEEKASTKESSHGNGDSAGRESRQARSCSDGSHPPQFIDESTLHSCIHLYLYPPPPPHRTKSPLLVIYYSQPRQIIQCFDPISSNISPPPFLAWARARQWTFVWCSRSKNKATHWIDSSCLDRKNMDCILPELESILFKDSS